MPSSQNALKSFYKKGRTRCQEAFKHKQIYVNNQLRFCISTLVTAKEKETKPSNTYLNEKRRRKIG